MNLQEILEAFPEHLRIGESSSGHVYLKQRGCAIHHRPRGETAAQADFVLNEGEIAVYGQTPPAWELGRPGIFPTAVYSRQPSGPLAIPTGLVFLRLEEGCKVEASEDAIGKAGYEIAEKLPYAPQAAWLRAASHDPAEALRRLSELERLPNLKNIEPQLLMENFPR